MGNDDLTDTIIAFTLNGEPVASPTRPSMRLSDTLRREFDCTDVKIGCNAGDCGACTVLIDGAPACACIVALGQVEGCRVDTLRGLSTDEPLTRILQARFAARGAAQCGICTPGMLVTATALLRDKAAPTQRETEDALGGVLCRCTGYRAIIDAVRDAPLASDERNAATGADPVGRSLPRLDGTAKLDGSERFGDDVAPVDAMSLRVVRCPHHHADFVFGDIAAWTTRHGVERVLTAADVPGRNRFGVIPDFVDQPVFAESTARFRGEAIAAIVGSRDALNALELDDFPVDWAPRAALLGVDAATSDNALVLHAGRKGNVLCGGRVVTGNADDALSHATFTATRHVQTAFVEHAPIEPEAGYAMRVGDRLELHGCTQGAYLDRGAVAAILGLDPGAVRVVPSACGGGFGTKLDLSWQPFVALAAWHLDRPVRLAYTRRESMQSTTKRHPATLTVDIGCDADGRLAGLRFRGRFDTGAYASWGPTVANRVPVHGSGPYRLAHYDAEALAIHTHATPSGAFRGFGVPQSAICQEGAMDLLADAVGIDRLDFRRRNALVDGDSTVTGQCLEHGVGIGACLDALQVPWRAALARRDAFCGEPDLHYGVGIASGWYGCGNTSLPNPSTIRCGIRADGTIVLHQGAIDIGQGAETVITQLFAAALGVPVDRIERIGADTDLTPDAGKTSASRQTFVSGNAAVASARALRLELLTLGNAPPDATLAFDGDQIIIDGSTRIDLTMFPTDKDGYAVTASASWDPPTSVLDANGQGVPYAQFGYAAQLVELIVDSALGTVKLERVVAAHDVGRAINPMLVRGQIEGGVAQGIGLALMEEFIPGRTENLHDYLIPTIGDVPPIETIIIEVPDPTGPEGAKGLGEHVLIPTAAAILNAIRDATGAVLERVPATPERVRAAIIEARHA